MIKKTIDVFGRLDILVNNAGVVLLHNIVELTEEEWNRIMDVNAKGISSAVKSYYKMGQKNGRIINILSSVRERI